MSFAPTLTGTVTPSPQVLVDFDTLDGSTATATIYRSGGNVATSTVRGGVNAFASGGVVITDFEVPLGVTVTYWAEMFDSSGASLGLTDTASTVVYTDEGYGWFSDPYAPDNAVLVPLRANFGENLQKTRDTQIYKIGSARVVLMGAAGLLDDINLACYTETVIQADMLAAVLDATYVLIRTTPNIRIPSCLYVSIPTVPEVDIDIQYGGQLITWPIVGQQMSKTDLDVAVPAVSWQKYIDAFATWQDMIDAYSTWLDAEKNPPV